MCACMCFVQTLYRRSATPHTAHRDIVMGIVADAGMHTLFFNKGWDSRSSQWHRLEDFVSDYYIRRYGLHRSRAGVWVCV